MIKDLWDYVFVVVVMAGFYGLMYAVCWIMYNLTY